jgi:hypothetical protein
MIALMLSADQMRVALYQQSPILKTEQRLASQQHDYEKQRDTLAQIQNVLLDCLTRNAAQKASTSGCLVDYV